MHGLFEVHSATAFVVFIQHFFCDFPPPVPLYIINLDRNVKDILETQFKKIRAELVYTFKFFYPEQRAWVTDTALDYLINHRT